MKTLIATLGIILFMTTLIAPLSAQDSHEIGLEPIYPELKPERTKLVPDEKMPSILETLPGWKYRQGVLYKIYETPSFTDAVALIVKISYAIEKTDHHPELRNIYGKVYVGFTTYDQGKKVTETDVAVAKEVEKAASLYQAAYSAAKAAH